MSEPAEDKTEVQQKLIEEPVDSEVVADVPAQSV